jgi:uncharacterized cupredoxin-like copper-binding protein
MRIGIPLFAIVLSTTSMSVAAHGQHASQADASTSAAAMEEQAFGRPGDPKRVSRTIKMGMSDSMRFTPETIRVKQGQTVRFKVTNGGKLMHEMVIGTGEELNEHAELMKKFPNMEHDEANMAHVAPGTTEDIVWQFTKAGDFSFGCLVPGHFDAGMKGTISVRP